MKQTTSGKYWNIAQILGIIGGIVAIIEGILAFIGLNILGGVLAILFAVLLLASLGIIKKFKFPTHWVLMIILGILMIWPSGAWIGGIITLIAGVVALVGVL